MNEQDSIFIDFVTKAESDERLLQSHLMLFVAMYYLYRQTGRQNCVKVTRSKLMRLAKMGSISTYHKCIKELAKYEYIIYQPSYYQGSLIFFKGTSG